MAESSNGNSGTATATSESAAKGQSYTGNANASNAANGNSGTGNTSNTSGTSEGGKGNANTSNTSTGATNSAGLMGSLMSFGNAVTGNVGNTYGGSGSGSGSDSNSDSGDSGNPSLNKGLLGKANNALRGFNTLVTEALISPENARNMVSPEAQAAGDKAYTEARAMGKTEEESQALAKDAAARANVATAKVGDISTFAAYAFKGKNTGPTYDPSITAQANTNKTIAAGSSNSPAATTNNTPGNIGGKTGGIAGGNSESAAPSVSDATNTGVTNRGSTVANGGGTSVTDSGTGGSISSSVTPPSRDSSSIGLGVYDTDRANYDQDNWNRGMEVESSSLVSDEECKAFAKRAFMEDSEPFKKVRISIIKKC